ncbi:uncharacterized protein [Chiloscyllium punctatum]|uniref:uncharacterized protein n=1 Tax=Chiloscyllium punctatum TaxID=137246 RepID=UPI003B6356F5
MEGYGLTTTAATEIPKTTQITISERGPTTVIGAPVSSAIIHAGTKILMISSPVTRIKDKRLTTTAATGIPKTTQITISAHGPTTVIGPPVSSTIIHTGPSPGTKISMISSPVTQIKVRGPTTMRGPPTTIHTRPSTEIPMTSRPVTLISGLPSTGKSSVSQIMNRLHSPTTMRGPSQGTEITMSGSPVTQISGSKSTAITGILALSETSSTGVTLSTLLSPTLETVAPTCKTGLDPNNSCISYSCEKNMQIVNKMECKMTPECPESEKIWDEFHCCYSCPKKESLSLYGKVKGDI